jgi:diaminopimelate decarboxylase
MFHYVDNTLYCENVPLPDIARAEGTPCYVYSAGVIRANYLAYDEAFGSTPHAVCYAVKANSSLAVLSLMVKMGSSFDIVSAGELFRVLRAGGDPAKVVFSGVGKTAQEVDYALTHGIHSFNCESEAELALIDALASRRGVTAEFALRVNPDVDAATHPYISTGLRDHKFGIGIGEATGIYDRAAKSFSSIKAAGVSCHIGSQMLDPSPVMEAVDKILALVDELRAAGHAISHVDFGGGLGVAYKETDPTPEIGAFVASLRAKVEGKDLKVMVEPGRSIAGAAGVLLTRVLYRKKTESKEFVVVDAAMTDLIRPALYHSHHEIIPLRKSPRGTIVADVVGPVCESGDFLARDREVANVAPGDLLAICTAGAYGFVLSSNYNARPRAPEVLVDGDEQRVVRKRETFDDLIRGESV